MSTKSNTAIKSPVIRHMEFIVGGIHFFEMNASRRNQTHTQEICIETGMVRCSCEDFTYKHAPHEPTLAVPNHHCKHLHAAVEWLLNNGHLEAEDLELEVLLHALNPCIRCNMPDAEMPLCDERGRPLSGFMCSVCFAELNANRNSMTSRPMERPRTAQELRDEKVREIAQLQAFADHLETEGEGTKAAHTRRRANYLSQQLAKEIIQ